MFRVINKLLSDDKSERLVMFGLTHNDNESADYVNKSPFEVQIFNFHLVCEEVR